MAKEFGIDKSEFDKEEYLSEDIDMLMQLLVNALGFYITARIVPGMTIASWETLGVVAVVWGVLSIILKPILILLTLPVNFLTLGLFTFVINAGLIMLMAGIVPGFVVRSFGTALLAAVVLALLNVVLGRLK
jgi:putative membrane protein